MEFLGHIFHPNYNHLIYSQVEFFEAIDNFKKTMSKYKEETGYYSSGFIILDEAIDEFVKSIREEDEFIENTTHYVKDIKPNGKIDALGREGLDWYFDFRKSDKLEKLVEDQRDRKIYLHISPLILGELDGINLTIKKILTFNIIGIEKHDDEQEFELDFDDE